MSRGWVIYNSRGVPLVTSKAHDHTAADGSGRLTDDEHDGFSEYDEIATPSTPAANKARLYVKDFSGRSAVFYKDDAGNEFQVGDKLWLNYPVYGTAGPGDWLQQAVSGGSSFVPEMNRLDLKPSSGYTVVVADQNAAGISLGVLSTKIDWSARVLFKVRFTVFTADSGTTTLIQLGRALTPGFTEVTGRAISVRIDNLVMKGQVHDGSSITNTGTLANLTVGVAYELPIISRGDGTVEWFLNGASLGTSTGGPTGLSTANETVIMFGARDTSGTNGRFFVHQVDVLSI